MTQQALPSSPDDLKARASELGLHGVLAHWGEYSQATWLATLIEREESERRERSRERRVKDAHIGQFKLLADFDWSWPKRIDRDLVEEVFTLDFLKPDKQSGACSNIALVGPNGVGKTMLAQNLAYKAAVEGYTVRYATASQLLNELVSQETQATLARRLQRFVKPHLLAIDEVGYLSYDSRHADLLFEVISRRSRQKSTVITTNRAFSEWGEVFPNATSVVALVDRLTHQLEVVEIEAESYRKKESQEREARRASERAARRQAKRKKR